MNHRTRNFGWGLMVAVCWMLTGCQIIGFPEKKVTQDFDQAIPTPLRIQLIDARPKVQRGEAKSPEWIYYTRAPEEHVVQIGLVIGNQLDQFGAIPGYQLIGSDVDVSSLSHVLRITYQEGYARWPSNPNRSQGKIQVEGRAKVVVELLRNGKRNDKETVEIESPNFPVPIGIIRQGNVRKIVGDSLEHQFQTTHDELLDTLMRKLSKRWPRFVNPKLKR